jgi:hypothetical protein
MSGTMFTDGTPATHSASLRESGVSPLALSMETLCH